MANVVRIKRRAVGGSAGAPSSLANAELAYNESDAGNGILYYGYGTGGVGGSATQVVAIAGDGAFVNLTGAQTISGNKIFTGTLTMSGATIDSITTTSHIVVGGNLTVNGTTTTVNSTTVTVDDKNIELGSVTSPTDAGADGGGITLKGTTDKTFNWVDATDAWTSSEHLNLLSGKSYYIDGTQVLSSTALGAAVVTSSLTSVGTITSGTWNGTTIATANGGTGQSTYTDGQLLIGNSAGGLAKATLTAGSNVTITNGNGTISIAATNTNTTYTAGDGLDLSVGNEFSLDIKSGRGLQITSTELDLDDDLATLAGMQTGAATALALLTSTEVGVIDGGTTATATTLAQADRMVINDNGTMAQVALSDLVTFLEDGATSGFDVDGGTF
jgi:hypothetical protein